MILFADPPSWIEKMNNDLGLAELQELAFFVKEKWMLNMASRYWVHLTANKQGEYAALYQKYYAQQIGQKAIQSYFKRGASFQMSFIPPGQFLAGAAYAQNLSGPQHFAVITKPYWISTTEVTQKQWKAIFPNFHEAIKKNKKNLQIRRRTAQKMQDIQAVEEDLETCNYFLGQENTPMTSVEPYLKNDNKSVITTYLSRLGGNVSLPSEYQWEYACRAGLTNEAIFIENLVPANFIWYKKGQIRKHKYCQPVATKQANFWHIFDMLGNAAEWCKGSYNLYNKFRVIDPQPIYKPNASHSIRGGNIWQNKTDLRATRRSWATQGNPIGGFRFIKEIK